MISYQTWRLLNESLNTSGFNLGIKSVPAVGGIVSQHGDGAYYEMKKKMLLDDPEAMDDESDVPMDDDEDMHMHDDEDMDMDSDDDMDHDEDDMDMDDEMSDEDMDDEMGDMDHDHDEMGDDLDDDVGHDHDEMGNDMDHDEDDMDMDEMPPPRRKPMPPMGESKKHCGMDMKGMKKKCGMGMPMHDEMPGRVKKVTIIKQEQDDFLNSICKQVKGDHKRFQEDAIYAPPNDNAGLTQPGEVGYAPVGRIGDDSQKELGNSNDFGYTALPTLEQFIEWKKMEADGGDKKMYSMLKRCIKKGMDFDACKKHCAKHGHKITKSDFNKCKKMVD